MKILAHRVGRQIADALGGAQHASPQRVRTVVERPALVVGPKRRLILVHLDLFQNHLLLGVEIVLAQGRPKDVGQQVHGPVLVLGQHGRVVNGVFLVGEGIVMGAHLVELAVHIVGRAAGGALEDHVLQKMAHAGHAVGFIAGAGVYEEPQCRGIGRVVALGDDLQAVRQDMFKKFH